MAVTGMEDSGGNDIGDGDSGLRERNGDVFAGVEKQAWMLAGGGCGRTDAWLVGSSEENDVFFSPFLNMRGIFIYISSLKIRSCVHWM